MTATILQKGVKLSAVFTFFCDFKP